VLRFAFVIHRACAALTQGGTAGLVVSPFITAILPAKHGVFVFWKPFASTDPRHLWCVEGGVRTSPVAKMLRCSDEAAFLATASSAQQPPTVRRTPSRFFPRESSKVRPGFRGHFRSLHMRWDDLTPAMLPPPARR